MFLLSILRFGSSDVAKLRNAPEKAMRNAALLNAGAPALLEELDKYNYNRRRFSIPREVGGYIPAM